MALNSVTTGNTVLAGDVNQLVAVLQHSAGQTETGKWLAIGNGYTTSATIGCYIPSLSRISTPVSVTVDTADVAPTGVGTVTATHLTASGFQAFAAASAAGTNIGAAGNYTIQF